MIHILHGLIQWRKVCNCTSASNSFRASTFCVESQSFQAATRAFFIELGWLPQVRLPLFSGCLYSPYMGSNDGASWFPVWNLWESKANLITIFQQAKGSCKHWCFLKVVFSCTYLLGRSWMSDTCFAGWNSALLARNPIQWRKFPALIMSFQLLFIHCVQSYSGPNILTLHNIHVVLDSEAWLPAISVFLAALCPPQGFHQQHRHRRQNGTYPFLLRIF